MTETKKDMRFTFTATGTVAEVSRELSQTLGVMVTRVTLVDMDDAHAFPNGTRPQVAVTAFRDVALKMAEEVQVGDTVTVEGRIRGRQYLDRDGRERHAPNLVVDGFKKAETAEHGFSFELHGRVTGKPKVDVTPKGDARAVVTLEHPVPPGDRVNRVDLTAYRRDAMDLAKASPGEAFSVRGPIRAHAYEKDGRVYHNVTLLANEVISLTPGKEKKAEEQLTI